MENYKILMQYGLDSQYRNHLNIKQQGNGSYVLVREKQKDKYQTLNNLVHDVLKDIEKLNENDRKEVWSCVALLKASYENKLSLVKKLQMLFFSTEKQKQFQEIKSTLGHLEIPKTELKTKNALKTALLIELNQKKWLHPKAPNTNIREFLDEVLDYLLSNGYEIDLSTLIKIFKGAHIILEDGGELYGKIRDNGNIELRERMSSHKSDDKQYGISASLFHEILFSRKMNGTKPETWFQLENTPWSSNIKCLIGHSIDFIVYRITGKNVGPYGRSEHTDKNPLNLRKST